MEQEALVCCMCLRWFYHGTDEYSSFRILVFWNQLKCYILPYCLLTVLAQALRANPAFSALKLRDCDIDANGTSILAELVMQLSTLTVFDLSFNRFNSYGLKQIGKTNRTEHVP